MPSPDAFESTGGTTWRPWSTRLNVASAGNVALTVQSAVMAPVKYWLFVNKPPQVPPTTATWPESGATLKNVVSPWTTVCGVLGKIDPPGPALGVTVYCFTAKLTVTVQGATIGAVVYVLFTSVPPQVPPIVAAKPGSGVTVKDVVAPCPTDTVVLGRIVPLSAGTGVTSYMLSVKVAV